MKSMTPHVGNDHYPCVTVMYHSIQQRIQISLVTTMKLKQQEVYHTLITLLNQDATEELSNYSAHSLNHNAKVDDQYHHARNFVELHWKDVPNSFHKHLNCLLLLIAVGILIPLIQGFVLTLPWDTSVQVMNSNARIEVVFQDTGSVTVSVTVCLPLMKPTAILSVSLL